MILFNATMLFVVRRGYVYEISGIIPLSTWVFGVAMVYVVGTIRAPVVSIFLLAVLISGLLGNNWTITAYTALSLLAVWALMWAEGAGLLAPVVYAPAGPAQLITIAGLLLAVAVLLALVNHNIRQSLARARRNERDLAHSNQELQAIRSSLEDQVVERTRSAEAARQEAEAANLAQQAQMRQITSLSNLNDKLRGEQDTPTLANAVINHLCRYLEAQIGALYLLENDTLRLMGSYAYARRKRLANEFKLGQGLVGQAALEKQTITLTHVPDDYVVITSGLGQSPPRNIVVAPFMYEGRVIGALEIGTLADLTEAQVGFLNAALESIAIAFNTAQARARINELLAQTQRQAAELGTQQAELRSINEELEAQTANLQASQERLRAQQSQLEATNVELEEKAAALQEKQDILDQQNRELRAARAELETKAQELTLANKYKSEFMANMSHELRTPLNSLLILARMLAANEDGNMNNDQVESAQIIYNGTDLLNLINEILDLSKVEAGKMTFHITPMSLAQLIKTMQAQFAHVAEQKGLSFEATLAEDAPNTIDTDQQRIEQIVKNLLSNAFKFTASGSVQLVIERPAADEKLRGELATAQTIAIRVRDSGIGMTPDQQKLVFEAFQQADGSTSRKYGGTGLGLTISRELAARLGGYIGLQSEFGKGSTFTLYLPCVVAPAAPAPTADEQRQPDAKRVEGAFARPLRHAQSAPAAPVADDRDTLRAGDKILLVIEDDPAFAQIAAGHARKKGFRGLIATDGESGLSLVETYKPNAIMLDLKLPGLSGWQVLEALKQNPQTRHIPVHIISGESATLDAFKMGAIGFLTKPVSAQDLDAVFPKIEQFISGQIKVLLVVEDDDNARRSIKKLLAGSDVHIHEAASGQAALTALRERHFDCMILDLTLPDMSGFELLDTINADESVKCPIIVYTGKALTEEENAELMKYANSVILKGVKSPERLLDETALFLHRVAADMSQAQPPAPLPDKEVGLEGKHVLVVDDDMRNAYALSKALREKGIKVQIASSGQKALELLATHSDIDLVLMDIMMPEMDGYETTQRIRAQAKFRKLPILALTAKAMKGDADKCIAAGANDYLSKPVDVDRLFSMLRVWLCG